MFSLGFRLGFLPLRPYCRVCVSVAVFGGVCFVFRLFRLFGVLWARCLAGACFASVTAAETLSARRFAKYVAVFLSTEASLVSFLGSGPSAPQTEPKSHVFLFEVPQGASEGGRAVLNQIASLWQRREHPR